MQKHAQYLLLNVGHFLDHFFMLVFATVAALSLSVEWNLGYAELIPYATPGFIAFGLFAVPAGWLADRWNRHALMVVFFIGIGLSAVATAIADTPLQMGIGLFFIGVFAAIYHPVGIALVLEGQERTGMRVAFNGVWGNMGVACAALVTACFIDSTGWRSAFIWPGLISAALGIAYWRWAIPVSGKSAAKSAAASTPAAANTIFLRVLVVIFLTTALGGVVFQSTTFALPKILAERASDLASNATLVGQLAFAAFAAGSIGQLVVGYLLDRFSPRRIFMLVATMQVVFFAVAVSAQNMLAVVAAVGYMLAAFGQIPINDVLIGRIARSSIRGRILAVRYTITILVMACSVPMIAWVHANYGFSLLFKVLVVTAAFIFLAAFTLPAAIVPARPNAMAPVGQSR